MMRTKLKTSICLMLAILCMASFSITAFASDGGNTTTTTEAETTAETKVSEENTEDFEIPYSYTIDENGNLVITVGGIADPAEKTTIGTVTTNGGRLNVRTGAGMSYEVIDQLRNGEEVKVIGSEGDWYEVIIPEKKGYVYSGYLELIEKAEQNSEIDSAMLMCLMKMMFQDFESVRNEAAESSKPPFAFTPNGNLTLIDDYLQVEAPATEDGEQVEKQFITVQSKNGNTFYIVIDRNGETENVYFMNLVDEADLYALIEGEDSENAPTCTCTDKCAIGAINTKCEICRSNMSECMGKETAAEPESTEPAEETAEETKSANFLPLFILLIAGAAGGAVYWFKFRKPKAKTSGNSDLDDYDFGEDDEEETEYDDADLMAESEDDSE